MAHTDPVKHAVRPPPRTLTVVGAVAAAAAAVIGVLALWNAPDGPVGSGLTTARTIAASSSPAFPLTAEDLAALLDRPPELGPLADPARRASCLSGLGYPAAARILGARSAGSDGALVLVLADDAPDRPGALTALAVALTCSAADTGLLGQTEVPAVRRR